jgi:chemotaxis protein methyltransferase CheR
MANEFVGMTASTAIVSRAKRYLRVLADPIRYRLRVRFQPRQNHIYTQFYRFPKQYEVLTDHVLPRLLAERNANKEQPIEVAVFACCSGEEVYTLAHVLAARAPGLPIRIRGYDIVPEVIEQAKLGKYKREQVYSSPFVTDAFVNELFDVDQDNCTVKAQFASVASFEVGDITDERYMNELPRSDFVFAQNVLFHLPRPVAKRAFKNLVAVLRPGGALFINGMDTDMRVKLTKKYGLEPITERIAEIHEDARVDRGANWASSYWGREPLKMSRNWVRKYCTIYRKTS